MSSFLAERAPLATVAELAAYCGTGEDWIRTGCADRSLPHCQPGGQLRFTPEQVEQILAIKSFGPKRVLTRDEVSERRQRKSA